MKLLVYNIFVVFWSSEKEISLYDLSASIF